MIRTAGWPVQVVRPLESRERVTLRSGSTSLSYLPIGSRRKHTFSVTILDGWGLQWVAKCIRWCGGPLFETLPFNVWPRERQEIGMEPVIKAQTQLAEIWP